MTSSIQWANYTVQVTLVPCSLRPAEYKDATAIIETITVPALDQHMAGLLACKEAENRHKFYQAIFYEVT